MYPCTPFNRDWLKRLLVIFSFSIFIWSGFSCSPKEHAQPDFITYWSANNQYEQDLAKVIVAEWNQRHPEMPVKHQPIPESQSSEEVILAAVIGKATPDVYSNMWPGDVQLYVNAQALVPLSDFMSFDSVISSRVKKEILEESRSLDGKVYQIPWKTNPIMMIYNKKMLAENGFPEPPRTYSEFERQAEIITADLDGDGYTDRYMGLADIRVLWWQRFFDFYTFYIAASGGQTLLKQGKVYFNNPAAVAVFDFFRSIYENGYIPMEKYQARVDPFLSGRVATRFTGPWEITHAEKLKPAGFEYDFAPIPIPDSLAGPVYTYGDFKNIVMFKTRNDPAKVWPFVEFMISRENDYRLLEMTNQLPIRKKILDDSLFQEYFARNPLMLKFARQAEFVRGADVSKDLKEIFDAISQEYEASVIYQAKTSAKAVADAAKRAELIMR
ncbi:MAG: extracellular solute-binding protein [bacterium]